MAGDFETIADIYRYLLDGGKVTHNTWDPSHWVHLAESGALEDEEGSVRNISFLNPDHWVKHVEPPKVFDCMTDALKWMLENPDERRVCDPRDRHWFWKDGALYVQHQRGGFYDSTPQISITTFNSTFIEVK